MLCRTPATIFFCRYQPKSPVTPKVPLSKLRSLLPVPERENSRSPLTGPTVDDCADAAMGSAPRRQNAIAVVLNLFMRRSLRGCPNCAIKCLAQTYTHRVRGCSGEDAAGTLPIRNYVS